MLTSGPSLGWLLSLQVGAFAGLPSTTCDESERTGTVEDQWCPSGQRMEKVNSGKHWPPDGMLILWQNSQVNDSTDSLSEFRESSFSINRLLIFPQS